MSEIKYVMQIALKLEKSAISKVQKGIFHNVKNSKKIKNKSIFAPEKSLKLPKMQISERKNRIFGTFELFSSAKIDFLHF